MSENYQKKEQSESSKKEEFFDLEDIRRRFREFKKQESDVHLKDIDPDDLLDEDLIMIEKFGKNEITQKDWWIYRQNILAYCKENAEKPEILKIFKSRNNFFGWMGNKLVSFDSKIAAKDRIKDLGV